MSGNTLQIASRARSAINELVRSPVALVLLGACVLGQRASIARAEETKPSATDVFISGEGDYKVYRIPSLLVTKKGAVLAFCEGRKNGTGDTGNIDLVVKRSTDGGKTWGKLAVIYDDDIMTVGNPCPVVDRDTGTIWMPFCESNKEVFVTHSDDDGVTWAKPTNITEQVKKPGWGWYATGPGHGIQLRNGRLLIPCDHKTEGATKQQSELSFSHVIYSDDHGKTWKLGGTLGEKTNECQAVETEDGKVYLNMRSYAGKGCRAIAWSKDKGETFSETVSEPALPEPKCQASLLRLSTSQEGKSRVMFANPASGNERKNMTLRISYDDCKTWPVAKVLNPDRSVYSDLAILPDKTILCLYENGPTTASDKLTLVHMTLEWLTDGKDSFEKK